MQTRRSVVIVSVLASWLVPAVLGAQLVPVGGEFQVNTYTTGSQFSTQVAVDSAGNFVVVWFGSGAGDADGIFGQRYASGGAPVGTEFQVNTYTSGRQDYPDVG